MAHIDMTYIELSSRHGHKYSKYKNRLGMISLYVLSNT